MAHHVPSITPKSTQYELKLHQLDPEKFIPNGDRYVVEVLDIDDRVELGSSIVVVSQDPNINPRDPSADPMIERRGILAAVIIAVGNGHLLGLPDLAPEDDGERPPASVPMFYAPGDVVFLDVNAKGRALRMVGREVRICNQIDVLCKIEGVALMRVGNHWEETVQ